MKTIRRGSRYYKVIADVTGERCDGSTLDAAEATDRFVDEPAAAGQAW